MTDQERLAGYVDVWWQAINNFTALLEKIPPEQWSAPTDLAGWDVLPVGRAGGEVAVADGRLSVTSDRLVHLVFRSITALGCGRLARSGLRSFARSRRSVCSP